MAKRNKTDMRNEASGSVDDVFKETAEQLREAEERCEAKGGGAWCTPIRVARETVEGLAPERLNERRPIDLNALFDVDSERDDDDTEE